MAGRRPARRGHGASRNFSLWPAETDGGWRVVRQVSFAEGETKVARGEWRRILDGFENHIGYQVQANCKVDEELSSGFSSPSITVRECELNAGLRGRSRTAGMPEERRISRRSLLGRPLAPEDAIERAQEKVRLWPKPANVIRMDEQGKPVYGDKAVRVYPKS